MKNRVNIMLAAKKEPMAIKYTVLLVEDEPEIRRHFCRYFRKLDLDVIEAENGDVANQKLLGLNESVNLIAIFSDYVMPGKTGGELLEAVRAMERFKTIPFYICTGYSREKFVIGDANKHGANKILSKPINFETLRELINNEIFKNLLNSGGAKRQQ